MDNHNIILKSIIRREKGCMPVRVVVRKLDGNPLTPFVVHMETLNQAITTDEPTHNGFHGGSYCKTFEGALVIYLARLEEEGVATDLS